MPSFLAIADFLRPQSLELGSTFIYRVRISFESFSGVDRIRYEEKLIGTLSKCRECAASSGWLGKWHPNSVLASKGLWNVQGHDGEVLLGEDIKNLFG
jgi:hypothetical protein